MAFSRLLVACWWLVGGLLVDVSGLLVDVRLVDASGVLVVPALGPALARAMASGKTACLNVKCRGVISPIVAATSDKRDKASIE